MMYVLDSSCLIFMLEKFPKNACKELWNKFELSCNENKTVSTDLVYDYLVSVGISLSDKIQWLEENKKMFKKPTPTECAELATLIQTGKFEYYTNLNDINRNLPIATPFSIVQTKVAGKNTILVIDRHSIDADKIITICEELNIECIDYDEYLELI